MQNTRLLILVFILFTVGVVLIWRGLSNLNPPSLKDKTTQTKEQINNDNKNATASAKLDLFKVIKVIDGDTIDVNFNGEVKRVRYIGIDTPETKDPRRGVECFGAEAESKNRELVEGKLVRLEKDVSETDKYGRILRYVFVKVEKESEIFVNDFLVRQGYAQVVTFPPDVKYVERFKQAQQEARSESRGLWGKCL